MRVKQVGTRLIVLAAFVFACMDHGILARTIAPAEVGTFLVDSILTVKIAQANLVTLTNHLQLTDADTLSDIPTAADETRAAMITSRYGNRSARITLVGVQHQGDSLLLTYSIPAAAYVGIKCRLDSLAEQPQLLRYENNVSFSEPAPLTSTQRKMLIVSGAEWAQAAERYARYRRSTGWDVEVAEIENILLRQSGRDDAEKLRNELIHFHTIGGSAVLLLGDERNIPVRYLSQFSRSTLPPISELFPADLYYADCTGDWNADNDAIWGEPLVDLADITPELLVGRLPVSNVAQVDHYLQFVIRYECPADSADLAYRTRALFFSSDQMRDQMQGQHNQIAAGLPLSLHADTTVGVETPRGDDPNPQNPPADMLSGYLTDGAGIVSVLAHGEYNGFVIRSAGINLFPKSKARTMIDAASTGLLGSFLPTGRPSFWHTIGCDNGGYDLEDSSNPESAPSMVRHLLLDSGNVIGMVAYSRWGWVSTSWLQQRAFFDSLRAHPNEAASQVMYESQQIMRTQIDQVYGQNYYGDPTMVISQTVPQRLHVTVARNAGLIRVTTDESVPVEAELVLSDSSALVSRIALGPSTYQELQLPDSKISYTVVVRAPGYAMFRVNLPLQIATDVNDDNASLPTRCSLEQNYPNPFNPTTTIQFSLPASGQATLRIVNLLGQTVRTIFEGTLSAGEHTVKWDGDNDTGAAVASGIYYSVLTAENERLTRSLVLLR